MSNSRKYNKANRKVYDAKKWVQNKKHLTAKSRNYKETSRKFRRNTIVHTAVDHAKKANLEFDKDYLYSLVENIPSNCACCGTEMKERVMGVRYDPATVSVDRVDNTKGYVCGNVKFICRKCNSMKRNLTLESLDMIRAYIVRSIK